MSQRAGLPCELVAGFVSAATNSLMLDDGACSSGILAARAPLGVLVLVRVPLGVLLRIFLVH